VRMPMVNGLDAVVLRFCEQLPLVVVVEEQFKVRTSDSENRSDPNGT
jgi:hypothetical protein